MNVKKCATALALFVLAFALFAIPVHATPYPANVTAEGTMTLTDPSGSFNVTIQANFTAMVPTHIEPGSYNASYYGGASVSEETVWFRGYLAVDEYGYGFSVEFTVENTFPEALVGLPVGEYIASGELTITVTETLTAPPEEATRVMITGRVKSYGETPAMGWLNVYAKVGERARVHVFWMPLELGFSGMLGMNFTFSFCAARLVNASMVELDHDGSNFYINGTWDVYNVTFVYDSESWNFTWTMEVLVDDGAGELYVTDDWKNFTVNITDMELISGEVFHHCTRFFDIPRGDVNSDHIVDIFDLIHVAKAYGTTPGIYGTIPGMVAYDFDMDLNFDFIIDLYDLLTIAIDFGKGY